MLTDPKEGDILLVHRKPKSLLDRFSFSYRISRSIQKLTNSRWNHVAGFLRIHKTLVLIEAQWDSVKIRHISAYDKPWYETRVVSMPDDGDRLSCAEFWADQLFEKYDRKLILRMGWVIWKRGLHALREFKESRDDDFWICSELIQAGWRRAGLPVKSDLLTPADFDDLNRVLSDYYV